MSSQQIRGVVPPVCTPLTPELEVDHRSLERLIGYLLEGGVNGLFVLGSTSEAAFLPDRQRAEVLETAVSAVAGRVPVLAGAIDMTTPRVLEHVRTAEKAGCDGVVATAPFYARTHPAEIEHHFRTLAERTRLPLFAYDLPVSVHSKLDAELLTRLARDGILRGVKDSSGDDAGLRRLLLALRRDGVRTCSVLTGSELTVDSALRMGADGVVPGLANVDPHGYARLFGHCAAERCNDALAEQERLFELFGIVDVADSGRIGASSAALGAFKTALHLRGIIDCPVTAPPQLPLTADEVLQVRAHLVAVGLL